MVTKFTTFFQLFCTRQEDVGRAFDLKITPEVAARHKGRRNDNRAYDQGKIQYPFRFASPNFAISCKAVRTCFFGLGIHNRPHEMTLGGRGV